jgi:hypothetical protein
MEKMTVSTKMDEEVKRWTAKRKNALVLEIIQAIPEDMQPTWRCRWQGAGRIRRIHG